MFLAMAAIDIYIPALPQMVNDFASSPRIINLTISCYTFGIAVGVLFVGELSNRFGRRKLLLSSIISFTFTSFIVATVHSILVVILCRIIQSIGAATIIVVSRLVLKDCLNPNEQLKANGLLLMGLVISPAIAPIIGGYLSSHFHWQSTFILLGGISTVLSWLSYKFIPETNYNLQKSFRRLTYYIKIYGGLLSNVTYLSIVLITACSVAAYFSFLSISSYLFILNWRFTPQQYSLLFLVAATAYLAGNFSMQILNRSGISIDKIIAIGIISTVVGLLIMAISPLFRVHTTIILVIIGMFLMRMATALINPATQIKIINQFSDISAQAIGLSFCIGFSLNSLAISSVTLFVHTPLIGLILVSGIFIIITALSFIFQAKKPDQLMAKNPIAS